MSYSYSVQDHAVLSGFSIDTGNNNSSSIFDSFIDRAQACKKTCFEQKTVYCNANSYAMM